MFKLASKPFNGEVAPYDEPRQDEDGTTRMAWIHCCCLERDEAGELLQKFPHERKEIVRTRLVFPRHGQMEVPDRLGTTQPRFGGRESGLELDSLCKGCDAKLAIQHRFSLFDECGVDPDGTGGVLLAVYAEELEN